MRALKWLRWNHWIQFSSKKTLIKLSMSKWSIFQQSRLCAKVSGASFPTHLVESQSMLAFKIVLHRKLIKSMLFPKHLHWSPMKREKWLKLLNYLLQMMYAINSISWLTWKVSLKAKRIRNTQNTAVWFMSRVSPNRMTPSHLMRNRNFRMFLSSMTSKNIIMTQMRTYSIKTVTSLTKKHLKTAEKC